MCLIGESADLGLSLRGAVPEIRREDDFLKPERKRTRSGAPV
jgi:hypothetical protein